MVVTVLVLAGLCVATCPDRDAHSEALKDLFNRIMTTEMSKDVSNESEAGLVMFLSVLGTGLGGLVIDNVLNVDNYFVCSIGTITYNGETQVVSVGVLNHVFTARPSWLQ